MFGIEQFFAKVTVVVSGSLDQRACILEITVDRLHSHSDTILLYCGVSIATEGTEKFTYCAYLFTDCFSTVDLLLVGGGIAQSLCEDFDSQLAHSGADTERLDPVSPKELVAEEWLDDCRDTSCVCNVNPPFP